MRLTRTIFAFSRVVALGLFSSLLIVPFAGARVLGPFTQHPIDVSGTTEYVNQAGVQVAVATWRVTTSSGTAGQTGQATLSVTVTNKTASCSLSGVGFGLYGASPLPSGTLINGDDYFLYSINGYTVGPGVSISRTDTTSVLLPSYIYGAGLDAAVQFFGPDPNRQNASYNSRIDQYVAIAGSCFDTIKPAGSLPEIRYFTADQAIVEAGESTNLRWSVSGATTSIVLAPVLTGNNPFVPSDYSAPVFPTAPTTYTLTASNPNGSVSKDVNVIVTRRRLVAPQIAFGGDWETSVVISNPSQYQNLATLSFSDNGGALAFPSREFGTNTDFKLVVPPFSTITITSPPPDTGPTREGWATLWGSPGGFLQGFAVFRQNGVVKYEATVPFSQPVFPPGSGGLTIPFDNTGGFVTGIAIVNAASLNAYNGWFFQASATTEDGLRFNLQLDPLRNSNHTSFVLTDRFPQLKNKKGLLQIKPDPLYPVSVFTALGLRFSPSGPFTTLPVFFVP